MTTIQDLQSENAELKNTIATLGKLVNRMLAVTYILQDAVKSNTNGDSFRSYVAGALGELPADFLPNPFA